MKIYLISLFAFCIPLCLIAQIEVPLEENSILQRYQAEQSQNLPKELQPPLNRDLKRSCSVEREGAFYILSGETFKVKLDIPISGQAPTYTCDNCEEAQFGVASVSQDSFQYIANAGLAAESETVTISRCNEEECVSQTYQIVVKRTNQSYQQPGVDLAPETAMLVQGDPSLLPGPIQCSTIIDCPDDYAGREQLSYFTDYSIPDNQIVYQASRFAGTDSICLVLCDTFAICDTFQFAFTIPKQKLTLPLMDDFSYDGPVTDKELWLDSEVFVNTEMAVNAPSVGIATFDGVDDRGNPYGGGFGAADRLTSGYIDLGGISPNQSVFLSYWVQRQGLGDRPEPQDSLVLQFKNSSGEWRSIRRFEGAPINQPNTTPEPFRFFRDTIDGIFKHDDFQFRFINYSERQGILDSWQLDYVRVSDIPSQTDTTFTDIAFTARPRSILRNYTSMPWRHLKAGGDVNAEEIANAIEVQVYNHFIEDQSVVSSNVRLHEIETDLELFPVPTVLFNNTDINIPNGESLTRTYQLNDDPSGFPNVLATLLTTAENPILDQISPLEFSLEYQLSNTGQINAPGFEDVTQNDFVQRSTIFDNYFAHDDGTAESGVIASFGSQIATQFTAGVADSLRAVQFHFPHTTTDIGEQQFHIYVWVGELDEDPEYAALFVSPAYTNTFFDTLQGFTTYPLVDSDGNFSPIGLPAGDFYIGWEQATNCQNTQCIPVGYDKNTPEGKDFIFRNTGFAWEPLPSIVTPGALMIRAVVGSETPGFTSVGEIAADNRIQVFPNPSTGHIQIRSEKPIDRYRIAIFDNMGRQLIEQAGVPQLDLSRFQSGMYNLILRDQISGESIQKRIVLFRE